MTSPTEPPRRPRSRSAPLFAALLAGGLALLVLRALSLPDVTAADLLIPALGGGAIAAALVVLVIRDRAQRRAAPPEERDRPDQGMPP